MACYICLLALTVVGQFTDKIPIQINITIHSMLIIIIGSYKSLEEMIGIMKKIHVDKNYEGIEIERMSTSDAWQFPIVAGCTLCGLYFSIQYFGKETVNYFILVYIAVGGATGIKAMINSFMPDKFAHIDKEYILNISVKFIGLEIQATLFDFVCCGISCLMMLMYFLYKSWIFNNAMAFIFCIHAL